MQAADSASFELVADDGRVIGRATLSTLPSMTVAHGLATLLDHRPIASETDTEPVQLLEGCEYLYVFDVGGATLARVDKSEIFIPDDQRGTRGRVRTGLATGRVEVRVCVDGSWARPFAFEVRSSKLNYLEDYRWMLESVAEVGASLLLERFAPSEQRLKVDDTADAEALYQRFVFLRGLLYGERLNAALRRILAEPYVQWERVTEERSPGRGLRGGSRLARSLAGAGARGEWRTSPHPALSTIPLRLRSERTEETLDNVPNRFVLFALQEWRGLITTMLELLYWERRKAGNVAASVERGIREGETLVAQLNELIFARVFRDVGTLSDFPISNQVLQKKEGYREVLQAYLLVQLGAQLTWKGGEDVFGGGQRNVATLYEYWVFIELAKIVSSLCDTKLDLQSLVSDSTEGLSLVLRREKAHAIRGGFRRLGRSFDVELCFNQQFSRENGTWSRTLRPDCSLHIVPVEESRKDDDIWLHFDAKYRVNRIEDLIGDDTDEPALVAKAEDLYKMHTYRDAIVRAAGAYVVFPGTSPKTHQQYEEVLPGLGAFPLRPSDGGESNGSAAIRDFVSKAFDHVATHTTRHERARYWRRRSTQEAGSIQPLDASPFLRRPPADTPTLLAFVKSPKHHEWIVRSRLYNLRADRERRGAVGLRGHELSAEVVALYGQVSDAATLFRTVDEPVLLSGKDLADSGYPAAGGELYICLRLEALTEAPVWFSSKLTESAAAQRRGSRPMGAPIVVAWSELIGAMPPRWP